jgi:DNA processing protein
MLYPNEEHPGQASAPPDDRAEKRALIGLSLVPGVGPGLLRALLARFGSAVEARNAPKRRLTETPGVGPKTAESIRTFDGADEVDEQLHRAKRAEATLIAAWDERFPRPLRRIYDPPALLWVRGRLEPRDRRAVAIVGTRRCSDYGRRLARRFAGALAERGCTIVSGLAYGIDRAAHEGALDAEGGRTIAVFGTGIDRVYPSKHKALARRIATGGRGALLSEFPLGAGPDRGHFPARNRVVSGLAAGTLIVESHEQGGALITARQAVEQNREVFAVPGALTNKASAGANRLIQRGHARLVMEPADLLDDLNLPALPKDGEDDPGDPTSDGQATAPAHAPASPSAPDLEGPEQTLYEQLGPDPVHIDDLCEATEMDASTALVHLLSLEFKGLARQMAGKQFYKV